MADESANPELHHPPRRFPLGTVAATVAALGLFALLAVAFFVPQKEPVDTKPAGVKQAIQLKNAAILEGSDSTVRMSITQAERELISHARKKRDKQNPHGSLPFPTPPRGESAKAP